MLLDVLGDSLLENLLADKGVKPGRRQREVMHQYYIIF